jgi:kumamolisin
MASAPRDWVAVEGSERESLPDARQVGDVDPDREIDITLTVRARSGDDLPDLEQNADSGETVPPMSREEFAKRHGADEGDIERIRAFAEQHDLKVVDASQPRRTVVLRGRIADMQKAFGVDLGLYEHPELGTYRGRTGPVYVPPALAEIVDGVFGLDDRPTAMPRMRRLESAEGAVEPRAGAKAYAPNEVAQLYEFPGGVNGSGEAVAIIELGGGYKPQDLTTYFNALGIQPTPQVSAVGVDGGGNDPVGNPNSADGEVMLDIEVVGSVAPGARIVVYFAPNTTSGFLDAITTAVHDATHDPSVVSISWGQAEDRWTDQARRAFNRAFREAGVLGVTVCAASGDDGSRDGVNDGRAHVDFPAASPHVLACGGTRLESSGTSITSEVVWHEPTGGATGGGVSEKFGLPAYQQGAQIPRSVNPGHEVGRGVPDVSGDADPVTGYKVRVDGQDGVIGGTSAVAPLYAGLIALINEQRGHPAGFLNPVLYQPKLASNGFHDITNGNNGDYHARPGWDACTGLGSPRGNQLLAALGP